MIRRLTYAIGLVPYGIYLLGRWVVTGRESLDDLERFQRWGDGS